MKNTTENYNKLIKGLRKSKPILNDAEGLTERIMKQIEHMDHKKESRLFLWVRIVSSSAAVFLIGLFVFQQTEATTVISGTERTLFIETSISTDTLKNQQTLNDPTNLYKAYLCYVQQNSVKNDQLKRYVKHL